MVCGFGLDRTLYTVERLFAAFPPGKGRQPGWGGEENEQSGA